MSCQGLQIRLFQRFQARYKGQTLSCFNSQKVQELFSYLLLHRQRPHFREFLTSLLWHDSSSQLGRKYLRQTLWKLRSAAESRLEQCDLATAEADWIQLDPSSALWCDVTVFEDAWEECRGIDGRSLTESQAKQLQQAVALYRGELLEDWYYDWCLFERERLHDIYLMILDKLMGYCEKRRLWELGIHYGNLALRKDEAREYTYQGMMRLYYASGDRTTALRLYQRCADVLQRELSVEPGQRTSSLYRTILDDKLFNFQDKISGGRGAVPSLH